MAALKAASVTAFRRLGAELTRHGAPPALLEGAARAARDETRHTTLTARWAREYGGAALPRPPRATPRSRSLYRMACENVDEGCVGETVGAALALAQSAAAPERLRRPLAHIARDETRHAALAFRVHTFARERLDAARRRALDAGLEAALAAALARPHQVPDEVARAVGLPDLARLWRFK